MSDSNIVYLKTGNNSSVNVEAEGKVVIRPKIVKQVSPPVEGSITEGQRAELKEKVEEWVHVSGLAGVPVTYGGAYKRLCSQAKSAGRAGVGRLDNYPACDFERGMKYLRSEIGKLRKTSRFVRSDPDAARKVMLAEIHQKRKANGIYDADYRGYLREMYGVESAGDLDIGDLQMFRAYMSRGGDCLKTKPKPKNEQELREDSLRALMAERGGVVFDDIEDAHAKLAKRDPALFSVIGHDAFMAFWKAQGKKKICVLKRGRRPSSKEAPQVSS